MEQVEEEEEDIEKAKKFKEDIKLAMEISKLQRGPPFPGESSKAFLPLL